MCLFSGTDVDHKIQDCYLKTCVEAQLYNPKAVDVGGKGLAYVFMLLPLFSFNYQMMSSVGTGHDNS